MKKIIPFPFLIISFALCYTLQVNAQTQLGWAGGFGGVDDDYGQSTTVDGSGNVYTTGLFEGGVDFDPGQGIFTLASDNYSQDTFITKLDQNGNLLWAKQFMGPLNGSGSSITLDTSGNIYIMGIFNGTVDFDPGPNVFQLYSDHLFDIYICKLSPAGNFIWAKKLRGLNWQRGYSIIADPSDNIYVTGYFESTIDLNPAPSPNDFPLTSKGLADIFIAKYDSGGNFLWGKQIGDTGNEMAFSLAVGPSGNVYTTGHFYGTVDFDPGPGVSELISASTFKFDVFINKLDASGNFLWAKQIGGPGNDEGFSIIVDNSGIYTSGYFEDSMDFDPGTGTSSITSSGGGDIFVCKLNTSGNFLWAKGFGGPGLDFALSSDFDSFGDFYVTGVFAQTADFDPTSATANLTSAGGRDFFISKFSPSGNFEWAEGFGGTGRDRSNSIALDNSGNMALTGLFNGTVDFDPGSGTANLTSLGKDDIFILMYSEHLGVTENHFSTILLYPNPTSHTLTISSTSSKIEQVMVFDFLGRKVLKKYPNKITAVVNMESLATGMYVVEIVSEGKTTTHKIVKE